MAKCVMGEKKTSAISRLLGFGVIGALVRGGWGKDYAEVWVDRPGKPSKCCLMVNRNAKKGEVAITDIDQCGMVGKYGSEPHEECECLKRHKEKLMKDLGLR